MFYTNKVNQWQNKDLNSKIFASEVFFFSHPRLHLLKAQKHTDSLSIMQISLNKYEI